METRQLPRPAGRSSVDRIYDERPLPQLTVSPQPAQGGDTVVVTANQYLGPRSNEGSTLFQCPPRKPRYKLGGCVRLGFLSYNEGSTEVTLRRSLPRARGGLFDCARSRKPCVLKATGQGPAGTPLSFERSDKRLATQSIELSNTTGLDNFAPEQIAIRSPLSGKANVFQCADGGTRLTRRCDILATVRLDGATSADPGVTATIRPRRFINQGPNKYLDCEDPTVSCEVIVRTGLYPIGTSIPITIASSGPVEPPRLTIPKGPINDGRRILVTVTGLEPEIAVHVQCLAEIDASFFGPACAEAQTIQADQSGNATARLTLEAIDECNDPLTRCFVIATTSPNTGRLQALVTFRE